MWIWIGNKKMFYEIFIAENEKKGIRCGFPSKYDLIVRELTDFRTQFCLEILHQLVHDRIYLRICHRLSLILKNEAYSV